MHPLISDGDGVCGHLLLDRPYSLLLCMGDNLRKVSRMRSVNDIEEVGSVRLALLPVNFGNVRSCRIIWLDHPEHVLGA